MNSLSSFLVTSVVLFQLLVCEVNAQEPPRNDAVEPFTSPPVAGPSSYVLLDQVVMHTGSRQLHEDWDFNTEQATSSKAPTNWLAPESPLFDRGIYHWRVEVQRMERPWASPMSMQFGWWNITGDPAIRHIASPALILTNLAPPAPGQPWVYEQVGTLKSLDRRHM